MILEKLRNSFGEVYVTIEINEELNCIQDTWTNSFETQENFKNALEIIVALLEKYKLTKWLADHREMKGSWDFNRNWMVNELMPKAKKAGLMFEAIVIPNQIFSKLSTVETISLLEGYEIRQFDDIEKAKNWLKEVK